MGKCKNCIYSRTNTINKNALECCNEKFVYLNWYETPDDGLGYEDFEGYSARFEVGKNFGCIHFKKKEK